MYLFTTLLFLITSIPAPTAMATAASLCAKYPASTTKTTYASKHEICQIFSPLATSTPINATSLYDAISPDVSWTIEGTHPLAGTYPNRDLFWNSFTRITATQDPQHPWKLELINIVGGGEEEWSTVELRISGPCKNGLYFDNRYAWVLRWSTGRKIVEARAYLDSALVAAAIIQNEVGGLYTYSDIRTENMPHSTPSEEQLKNATGLQVQRQ